MNKLFIIIGLMSFALHAAERDAKDKEKLIYIMPEDRGFELVEQCTRSVYYPDSFWRVTRAQIDAIEKRLRQRIEQLEQQKDVFSPGELNQYKRQYIGFELDGQTYFYGNYFPKDADLEVDPIRRGVVTCRGDQRYWGMLFNIETFKFEAIERNDKMVKPPGVFDPTRTPPTEPDR